MTFLTRERLLGATSRRYITIETPLGTVRIRSLTEAEKSEYEGQIWTAKGEVSPANMRAQRRRLLALCLVDERGEPLLKPTDLDALREIDGTVTTMLFRACRSHCGFDDDSIEGAVKNSVEIDDDASAST